MGIFSESDSERAVREHNEGQDAGSKAGPVDKFVHRMADSMGRGYSDAYNKGWEHGVNNPSKDDHGGKGENKTYSNASNNKREKHRARADSTSSSGYSSSSSDSDSSGLSGVGVLLFVVIGVVVVIVLVTNGYKSPNGKGSNGKDVWVVMNVNTTRLNVRSGPGTENSVVAKFERGARLATTGEPVTKGNEQWVRVSTEDGSVQGWVNLKLLSSSTQLQEPAVSDKQEPGSADSLNDPSKLSPEKCQELIDSVVLVNPDFTFSVRNVDVPPECSQQLNDKYRFLQEKTNERNKMLKDRRRQM